MIAALLLSLQIGAIPGTPERLPGQDGAYSFVWSNDWFALPMSLSAENENDPHDDWRTNGFSGAARVGRWAFALDDSMLTSKALSLRTDEIAATVGYDVGPAVIGAGVRSRRDYRGEEIQNTWHRWFHDLPLHLEREDTGEDAVAYVLGEMPAIPLDKYFSLQPVASALIASNGESAADVGALIVLRAGSRRIFAGARYQWRDGADTPLQRDIQQHERGVAFQYGFAAARGFSFSVTVIPSGSYSGSLGWSF